MSIDEAKEIADKAQAIAIYYRARGASLEAANDASEIRLRAERRLGELLQSLGLRPGRKADNDAGLNPALDDIGITCRQSSVWQKISAVSEEDFEDRIATAKENSLELTTAKILGLARKVRDREEGHEKPASQDLKSLARQLAKEHTRAELAQFVAWVNGLVAKDEHGEEDAA